MAINNNEACYVPLNHLEERPQIELSHALEILKEIMEKTQTINGIKVETREQEAGPPRGKPINPNSLLHP